jgi:hypothetical protein
LRPHVTFVCGMQVTGRRDAVNGRIARLFEGYGTVVSVTARAKPDAPVGGITVF